MLHAKDIQYMIKGGHFQFPASHWMFSIKLDLLSISQNDTIHLPGVGVFCGIYAEPSEVVR